MKYEKSILLMLGNGYELMETSGFIDVFAWASFIEGVSVNVDILTVPNKVTSAFGGFVRESELKASDVATTKYDGLAIPGGMEFADFFSSAYSEDFSAVIRHFNQHYKPIAAVCVASLALANAGVLKGINSTIYHSKNGKHKETLERKGGVFVDQPIVKDCNLITSTGPGTSSEVALALLHEVTDEYVAQATRAMMRLSKPRQDWFSPQV